MLYGGIVIHCLTDTAGPGTTLACLSCLSRIENTAQRARLIAFTIDMNETLTQALYDEFPGLYAGRAKPRTDSSMCWGIQCGDGWFALLRELSFQLNEYANAHADYRLEAIEVKGKAGDLRYELAIVTDWTTTCIAAARSRARETCELTGKPGALCRPARMPHHGWEYRVLCDAKANEIGYRKVTVDSMS